MKTLIALLVVVASQVSVAAINNSGFEDRHQSLIENAVYNHCNISGTITQVNNDEIVNRVDQGIRDVYHTTTLKVKVGVDQYQADEYTVIVKSEYADVYDHVTQNWGVYSVQQVFCYNN